MIRTNKKLFRKTKKTRKTRKLQPKNLSGGNNGICIIESFAEENRKNILECIDNLIKDKDKKILHIEVKSESINFEEHTIYKTLIPNFNALFNTLNTQLIEIKLYNFPLTNDFINVFDDLNISSIYLKNNYFNDTMFLNFNKVIKYKYVQNLTISDNQIDNEKLIMLAKSLFHKYENTLKTLDLSHNNISDKDIEDDSGMIALSNTLAKNSYLKSLNLSFNKICNSSIQDLFIFKQNFTTLDLSNNIIDTSGIIALSNELKTNKILKTLNLSFNLINNSDADILYNTFVKSKSRHINLGINNINTTLKSLNLSNTNITTDHSIFKLKKPKIHS